jgi:hypothetical protein
VSRIPPLHELEPEELAYLRRICAKLRELDPRRIDPDAFDRDELGLDPEDDYDCEEDD